MGNKYDIEYIRELISRCNWRWAKTYLSVPHEYIVREKCELSDSEFLYIVGAQRELGIHERWGKYNFPYLYVDGYKYWTMGNSFDITKVINRQKVFSEFDRLNDSIQVSTEAERKEIVNMIRSTFKKPVFEAGFGDGWLISEGGFMPNEWYGVEPSKKLVGCVRERYPRFSKRVSCMSFEEAVDKWKGKDVVVLALFGSASYLMGPYLRILKENNEDYFLMFYKHGYCPENLKEMHHFEYTKQGLGKAFGVDVLEYGNYYIVSSTPVVKESIYVQQTLF